MHYVKICDYYEDSIARQHFARIWIIYFDHRRGGHPTQTLTRAACSYLLLKEPIWFTTEEFFFLRNDTLLQRTFYIGELALHYYMVVLGWGDIVCMLEQPSHPSLDSCRRLSGEYLTL